MSKLDSLRKGKYTNCMKRANFHITYKQSDGLELLSNETGLPMAEHIRRAIDEYLNKHTYPNKDYNETERTSTKNPSRSSK